MGAGHHPRTRKEQERGPRHGGKGHHDRYHDPHRRGDQRRPTPTKHPNTHHRSKHRTPCGSHQRTPTGHRKPHGERRAHLHGENGPHPQRRPQGTRRTAHHHALTANRRPRPPRRPTHRHRKRTEARPRHPRLRTDSPRGHGTKAQAPREGNPTDRHATTPWAIRAGLRHRRGLTQSIATGA